jgi:steroid delta-isomerase-like uncharacterized protein
MCRGQRYVAGDSGSYGFRRHCVERDFGVGSRAKRCRFNRAAPAGGSDFAPTGTTRSGRRDDLSVSPEHKELFGRLYHSIWNERRLEFIPLVIAETHALGDPTVAGGATGPSAYRRQVERFLTGLPDLHFDVHETISEGDRMVVYWTISGTHRGEFLGVPATNRKVSFSGITINQIRNGKIIESTVIWDGLGLLEQFGVPLPVRYEMLTMTLD